VIGGHRGEGIVTDPDVDDLDGRVDEDMIDATEVKTGRPGASGAVATSSGLSVAQGAREAAADGEPAECVEVAAEYGLSRRDCTQPVRTQQGLDLQGSFPGVEAEMGVDEPEARGWCADLDHEGTAWFPAG